MRHSANLANATATLRSSRWAEGSPRTLRTPAAHGANYFDVVGETPDGVVYNAGGRDLLFWMR
jgi:Domain of unknown function (DUF1942)